MLPKTAEHYTIGDIRRALEEKLIESETLEYKEDPSGKLEAVLAKAVSAFANAGGGNLVLGLGETPGGEPTETRPPGLPSFLGKVPTAEQVDRLIHTKVVPSAPVTVEAIDIPETDRVYIVVTVSPRGGGPYRIVQTNDSALNGRYYVRRGRDSIEADHFHLRSLFVEAEEGTRRVRDYLERRGLDETSAGFGTRGPFRMIPAVTWKALPDLPDPPPREVSDGGLHGVVAFAIPEILRGPVLDTTRADVVDALDLNKTTELKGFGFQKEPTLDGRWLVQRVQGRPLLGSYVEVHRTGYVEVSHSYAGVLYGGRSYLDAGAALMIAKAMIVIAARVREIADVRDRLLLGLVVRRAGETTLFAWQPEAGRPGRTSYEHLRIEQLADEQALSNPTALLRLFDERLGNAYGLDRTDGIQENGEPNRVWSPLGGREW